MELTFENIVGKTILVGITFLAHDEAFVSMIQFSGKIVQADEQKGIVISSQNLKTVIDLIPETSSKGNGDTYALPPDIASLQIAPVGEYRLKSTGEVVINPDILTTWTLTAPKKS